MKINKKAFIISFSIILLVLFSWLISSSDLFGNGYPVTLLIFQIPMLIFYIPLTYLTKVVCTPANNYYDEYCFGILVKDKNLIYIYFIFVMLFVFLIYLLIAKLEKRKNHK